MGNIKNILKKIAISISAVAVLFSISGLSTSAAPAVTISSPTNTSTLANGGSVPVSGTAPANTRVKILLDNTQVADVAVNGSGQWSTILTNIAKGAHTLKAVNSEPGLHYYATVGSPSQVHSINPLTGAIDTRAGFPIAVSGLAPVVVTDSNGKYAYVSGFVFDPGNIQRVDLETGAAQQVTSYPSSAAVNAGAFTSDNTKYYAPNDDGTITVIDVASNTILQTITTGASTHNSVVNIYGTLYATDASTGLVYEINQTNNSVTNFKPACAGGGDAVAVIPDYEDKNILWVSCSLSSIAKLDRSTKAVLMTANTPSNLAGIAKVPYTNKVFASSPNTSAMYVIDSNSGALLQTINLPAQSFAPVPSSDGSRILLPTPGGSFSGNDAVIINTSDYSLTNLTLDGPSLAMFAGPDVTAEATVQFTVSEVLANTGENISSISLIAGAAAVLSISALIYRKRNFSK